VHEQGFVTNQFFNLSYWQSDLFRTTGDYTDSSPAGVPVKAVHLQEVRNRVE